jgi:hypothetical protein
MSHDHAPTTAPAQGAARDQRPHGAAVVIVVIDVLVVAVIIGAAFTDKVGKEHPASPAAAKQAACDQYAHEAAIVAVLGVRVIEIVVVDVFSRFAALADQMGHAHATAAPAAQRASRDKRADDLPIFIAVIDFIVLITVLLIRGALFAQ